MNEVFLSPWTEVRGTAIGIEKTGDVVMITISFKAEKAKVRVPFNQLQFDVEKLKTLIGQRISILRTDMGFILNSFPQHIIKNCGEDNQ